MGFIESILKEDIVIGSASVPSLLAILAFILLIVWLMVFCIYLWKHHSRLSIKYHPQGEKKPVVITSAKKIKPLRDREDLKHYLGKLDTLMIKSKGQNPKKFIDEFYHMVREFAIELLGIGYTFSDDELIAILSTNARNLARFYWHVLEIRKHREALSAEKFEGLLSHFFSVVDFHTKKHTTTMGNLFTRFKNIFQRELSEEENKIENLLKEEKRAFEANLVSVKSTYRKILGLYAKLPYEEKLKLFPELLKFSHSVNDAMVDTVYGAKAKEDLTFFPRELIRLRDIRKVSMFGKISTLLVPKKEKPILAKEEQEIVEALKPKVEPEKMVKLGKPTPAPKPTPAEETTLNELNKVLVTKVKIKKIDHITRIYRLIKRSRNLFRKNKLNEAKATYESIKNNFVMLSEEDKRHVYPALRSLYNDLVKGLPPKVSKKEIKEDLEAEELRLRILLKKAAGMRL